MGSRGLEQDGHEAAVASGACGEGEGPASAPVARPEVLATVLELKRGVFHAHVVVGYYGYSREGLEVFLDALDELRGEYGFGITKQGGFNRGEPGKYTGPHAGLYSSKYLRPDGSKGSFIPALLKIEQVVARDPETRRPTEQLRPVYVNPKLTKKSGVTMPFLRWTRYAYRRWGALNRAEMLLSWQIVRTSDGAPRGDEGSVGPGAPADTAAFVRAAAAGGRGSVSDPVLASLRA